MSSARRRPSLCAANVFNDDDGKAGQNSSSSSTLPALLLSLRFLVLSHIAELESKLSQLEPNALRRAWGVGAGWEAEVLDLPEMPSTSGPSPETSIYDVPSTIKTEAEMEPRLPPTPDVLQDILALLDSIRSDVRRHLPDIDFDLPSLPSTFDFDMPSLPHLPSMQLPDLPSSFLPSLTNRIHQLSALAAPPKRLTDILSSLPGHFDFAGGPEVDVKKDGESAEGDESGKSSLGGTESIPLISGKKPSAASIAHALATSADGTRLITYDDLPHKWRNNEYIHTGYRFIPFARWPYLFIAPITLHNETINILTHLLPTLLIPFFFLIPQVSVVPMPVEPADVTLDALPRLFFLLSALCCLACSAVWHTVTGCSDLSVCEWGARVDYVGIGWLISASVTSGVYYGFRCDPTFVTLYTSLSLATGALGSILPFQTWFNQRRNKKWRIAFYLGLCGAALLPLAHLACVRGLTRTVLFFQPISASVLAYIFGLLFYAFHFPECCWPGRFDYIGASHQIWHICIVMAIWLHYRAVATLHVEATGFACSAGQLPATFGSTFG